MVQEEVIEARDGKNVLEFLKEEKCLLAGVHVHNEIGTFRQSFHSEKGTTSKMLVIITV